MGGFVVVAGGGFAVLLPQVIHGSCASGVEVALCLVWAGAGSSLFLGELMARRLPSMVSRRVVWNAATIALKLGTHRSFVEKAAKELVGREFGEFSDVEMEAISVKVLEARRAPVNVVS